MEEGEESRRRFLVSIFSLSPLHSRCASLSLSLSLLLLLEVLEVLALLELELESESDVEGEGREGREDNWSPFSLCGDALLPPLSLPLSLSCPLPISLSLLDPRRPPAPPSLVSPPRRLSFDAEATGMDRSLGIERRG